MPGPQSKRIQTSPKDRKKDHIELAEISAVREVSRDTRFYYEPVLTTHPDKIDGYPFYFLGKEMKAPIWISSMTGGTGQAKHINRNLARACREYGLGMGLGSCRKLLEDNEHLSDFDIRDAIGDQPLFANLGIAQVEQLIIQGREDRISELVNKLQADGLIVHINPTQEWLQPEGDRLTGRTPLQVIISLLEKQDIKIIVKEVGQGIGPESLRALLTLPLAALEFGAFGGTNFAKMESLRDPKSDRVDPISTVGHTADEMIGFIHDIANDIEITCREFIISGGIKNYLDGYYYNELLSHNSVYGQAAAFLRYAKNDYEQLAHFVEAEIAGYHFARRYLRLRQSPNE